MGVYISSIGIANPDNRYDQAQLVEFMSKVHDMPEDEKRKLTALYRASGIRYRYSVLKDFQMNGHYELYKIKDPQAVEAGTKARMEIFKNEALKISCKAIDDCTKNVRNENITHIITVSCTGFYAPGLDYQIIKHYELNPSVERYNINFMGCYAAINALKAAWNICKANKLAKVLVVCTELCSLHLQKEKSDDNLLANALFGDGAAAAIIQNENPSGKGLGIKEFHSSILPNGEEDMAWHITDFGFHMRLSQYVPDVIRKGIGTLSKNIFDKIPRDEIKHFLVHPGGKKILQVVEEHFDMTHDMNGFAYDILRNYGNMSSPTILFVMKKFLNQINNVNKDDKTLALAFGPGLTLESVLLEIG